MNLQANTSSVLVRKPLAACLLAALALGMADAGAHTAVLDDPVSAGRLASARIQPTPLAAATRHRPAPHPIPRVPEGSVSVSNCNDSGSGSLRAAIAGAGDGQTIDMTGLTCGTISLTTGSIAVQQDSLTLQGPGVDSLLLLGNGRSPRVAPLLHEGSGSLVINDLTVGQGARYYGNSDSDYARGGCIFSRGFVALNDAEVKYCLIESSNPVYGALGGAVYARTGISLSNTTIIDSYATATDGTAGGGGGIYTPGYVTIADSYFGGNHASFAGAAVVAFGGGTIKYSQFSYNESTRIGAILIGGSASIENSTINNNYSTSTTYGGGAICFIDGGAVAPGPRSISNSTISGNYAAFASGVYVRDYPLRIANSTIAFNVSTNSSRAGAGLYVHSRNVDLESTIIAENTSAGGASQDDIDGGTTDATLSGADNLIVFSTLNPPAGTISDNPQLLGLTDNGGQTATHALSSTSPAIDRGNDVAGSATDQRGSGFARVSGSAADIGAFEVQAGPVDRIFADGFEGS